MSGDWKMPTYDYRCEVNGRVLEVRHGMNEVVKDWGELCERSGVELGDTPADTPVKRLISGGQFISSSHLHEAEAPSCAAGPCCGGGVCGID
jgi:hypothetical protein